MSNQTEARQERGVRLSPIDILNLQYGEGQDYRRIFISGRRIILYTSTMAIAAHLPDGYCICRVDGSPGPDVV